MSFQVAVPWETFTTFRAYMRFICLFTCIVEHWYSWNIFVIMIVVVIVWWAFFYWDQAIILKQKNIYFVLPIKAWYKVFKIILSYPFKFLLSEFWQFGESECQPLKLWGAVKKGANFGFRFKQDYAWYDLIISELFDLSFLSLWSRKMIIEMS